MTTFECCARPKESRIGPHPKYLQSHLRLFLEKLLPMEAPSPHQIRQIPNLPPLRCMKNWKQFISTILSDLMRSMESWPHRISCGIGRLSPTFLASMFFLYFHFLFSLKKVKKIKKSPLFSPFFLFFSLHLIFSSFLFYISLFSPFF